MLDDVTRADLLTAWRDATRAAELAERLADYALGLTFDDLPEDVVHVARQRVVYTLGCALGAIDSEPAA